eukprot:PhF_6_TR19608/c0_g1_i1/m.28608
MVIREAVQWASPDDLLALQHLAGVSELFVMCKVSSEDEVGGAVDGVMRILGGSGMVKHRIFCYSTLVGKQAAARQLTPTLYIDSDLETIQYLHKHIPYLVQVA